MPIKKTSDIKIASQKKETKSLEKEKTSPLATTKSSECCMGTSPCSSTKQKEKENTLFDTPKTPKKTKTRVIVKYDVGFNNNLFLRGNGANLSWEKGTPLKNVKNDEWIWETDLPFIEGEFKVLINDKNYEMGENRRLTSGMSITYTPIF